MKLNVVAQKLKLSESTFSRSLNGYQDISDDTKSIMRKAASEIGYVPNPHARHLASGKDDNIAFIMRRSDYQFDASFLGALMEEMAEPSVEILTK